MNTTETKWLESVRNAVVNTFAWDPEEWESVYSEWEAAKNGETWVCGSTTMLVRCCEQGLTPSQTIERLQELYR